MKTATKLRIAQVAPLYESVPPKLYGGTFLGRISPEKRLDRAIEIAIAAGMPLKIAAKVDPADRDYFASEIKHLLTAPGIEYIGEIDEKDKIPFLGNAFAYLFPIEWPEPFGLTMIEAMRCGTPVIAFERGSVPEVMRDGVTGFVVNTVEEATAAVHRCAMIDRAVCRQLFQQHFTSSRMARDYVALYERLLGETSEENQEVDWTGTHPVRQI